MLVTIRPCWNWSTYASPPQTMSARSRGSHAQYAFPPRRPSRMLVDKNWNGPIVALEPIEVEELRLGLELALQHEDALLVDDARDLALGIEQVAELAGADRADLDARRIASRPRPLDAERALLDDAARPRPVAEDVQVRIQVLRRQVGRGPARGAAR